MSWTKRWRRRIRSLVRRDAVERELDEELAFHLEMETKKNLRAGMSPREARRRAALAFGGVERYKEEVRDARVLGWVPGLSLDLKLGFRMLVKYPGLTLVGGLALAFAICVGAGTFHFINQMLDPSLPLPQGERIVGLRYWDRAQDEEATPLPRDLRAWREELGAVQDLGGFQTLERNLAAGDEPGEPVRAARMSAVGFHVAGVAPLLGRALLASDEEPGAAPVVVLGHRVWQTRMGADPSVLGRVVRIGEVQATVVGVMPEGFAFPKDHAVWVPLPPDAAAAEEPLRVFGRLAPGATLAEAQAEAGALAARAAREEPERYRHLGAQVLPYADSLVTVRIGLLLRVMIYQLNLYAVLFLVLVSANVALLMFARTATREREIVVRSALGASRRRIVTQLFAESLVLAGLATVLGLAAAGPALKWVESAILEMGGELPFWYSFDVSPATVLYAGLLALVGAAVAGGVPALKATGRGMQARLQQAGTGAGGLRLGGIWTAVVIVQVAATVVFTGVAYVVTRQADRNASAQPYFPAEQYLAVRLEMDRETLTADTAGAAFRQRYAARVRELERRVAEHPSVASVALAQRLPIENHAPSRIEVEGAATGHYILSGAVDLGYFAALQAPVLSGRAFSRGDLGEGVNTVVVSSSFVERVLGGGGAIGRRIRYVERDQAPGPWQEIVGVVRDLVVDRSGSLDLDDPPLGRVYHPLDVRRAGIYPLHLVAHARGSPGALVPSLHRIAESVSPALRLHEPRTLDRANRDMAVLWRLYANLILLVSTVALVLAMAGIYAVMSFTVARRTREIGVRVALGAKPRRVIADILGRSLVQVAAGVALGCLLVAALVWSLTEGRATARDGTLLLAWGAGMLAVCGLASLGPTLRALWVEPAKALSADL